MVMLNSKFDTEISTQSDNNVVKSKENTVELKDYLNLYINEFLLEMKKRSNDTYKNYRCDINKLAKDMFGYKDFGYITKQDLEHMNLDSLIQYFNACYQEVDIHGNRKYSNSTINRRMSSLKSLLKYLTKRSKIDYPIQNMVGLLKSLPDESTQIDILSMEEAELIMEYFKDKCNNENLYYAAKTSIDTALRANELITLEWNQFYTQNDKVIVKSKGKIKGKGNKDWEEEISLDFYNELLTLKVDDVDKVFNISYSLIAKWMSRAIKDLGLNDKNYTFHSFRKRSITNTYDLTNDIFAAQEKANHTNINTTQRYVGKKKYGMTGIYSLGDKVDKELYKKVDINTLIETIESLDKSFIHLLNMKLNEKIGVKCK